MDDIPGLGTLSRLPPEIRIAIWEQLSLNVTDRIAGLQPHKLAFMRTSHQICDECCAIVYRGTTLAFEIDSDFNPYSWFRINVNERGWQRVRHYQNALSIGLGGVPYSHFKEIRIHVQVPGNTDRGAAICLWKKCLDVAELLEKEQQGFSDLRLYFNPPALLMLVSSMLDYPGSQSHQAGASARIWDGYAPLAIAFARLRGARKVSVHIPMEFENKIRWHRDLEGYLRRPETFGRDLDPEDPWDDVKCQQKIDKTFMDCDEALDTARGPTAEHMRQERFSSWFENGIGTRSRYVERIEGILERGFLAHKEKAIGTRRDMLYLAMRWNNPRSPKHDEWRDLYESLFRRRCRRGPSAEWLKRELFSLRDEDWDRDEWHISGCRCGTRPFPDRMDLETFMGTYKNELSALIGGKPDED